MCDGIHIVYFCRNERDHGNVGSIVHNWEREREKKAKNYKTQFMQLSYIVQNAYKLKKQNKYQ